MMLYLGRTANFRSRLKTASFSVLAVAAVGAITTGVAASSNATLNIVMTPGHPIGLEVTPESAVASLNDSRPACVVVAIKTALNGWSLDGSYTATPGARLDVALEPVSGGTCAVYPGGTAGHLNSAGKTTLLSNQQGSTALAYAIIVRSSAPLTSPVMVALTFTADAPGAPAAQAALAVGLDQYGRVWVVRP